MKYDAHLANRARLRAITSTPPAIPPLPVRPPSVTDTADSEFQSVIDNVVRLPTPTHSLGHTVDIRTLDGGRLNWKPVTEILGWCPGDRLAVSWSGEWLVLTPADEGAYSRIEVDDRGRIPIEAGLRSRLSLEPGDRVVVRIRPDTDAVEIANQWIVAVALAGFDCTSRADQDGERQQRTYKAFSTTNKEARNG